MVVRRVCLVAVAAVLVVPACDDADSSETSSSDFADDSPTSTTIAVATTVREPPATTTTSALPDTSQAPEDLTELDGALAAIGALPSADAAAAAATLYETLVDAGRVPFVDGAEVVFFYRGEGAEVTVLANFNWFGLYGSELRATLPIDGPVPEGGFGLLSDRRGREDDGGVAGEGAAL